MAHTIVNPSETLQRAEDLERRMAEAAGEMREMRKPRHNAPAIKAVEQFSSNAKQGHMGPFRNCGQFFKAVRDCGNADWRSHPLMRNYVDGASKHYDDIWRKSLPSVDSRPPDVVQKAVPAGLNETVGADGAYLVPPQFVQQLLQRTYDNDLLSRTTLFPMTSNQLNIPAINETSRADGSRFGGVRAFWTNEGASTTTSDPSFHQIRLTLERLTLIVRATDELIEDSGVALETYLDTVASQELTFAIGNAIYRGDGVAKPQGMLNSPALVSVAKETGQAAATFTTENVVKMWSRCWAGNRANSVWLVNQDVEPQLFTMTLGVGTGGVVTYMPPNGLSGQPYSTLMGRPVIVSEFCSTLGTQGDVMLADLSQYLTGTKGGIQSAVSMHVHFSTHEQLFRFTMRMDGRGWWSNALTPFQGTATKSPFVVLATRA